MIWDHRDRDLTAADRTSLRKRVLGAMAKAAVTKAKKVGS